MIPFPLLQAVGHTLLAHSWIFAKTMPEAPHWYTLRKTWTDQEDFVTVVQAMRQYGYDRPYKRAQYRSLNCNGMYYWTMGAPLPATILINRAVLDPEPHPYDAIAPAYDAAFSDPASITETQAVMDLIGNLSQADVLDIGCGTGTVLDYATPRTYTGIDPSHGMLARCAQKHPEVASALLACPLEAFVGHSQGYDLVLCLFGTANYIASETLRHLPSLVRPGGRYVVMFFAPGYLPVTYTRCGVVVPHAEGMHVCLPGRQTVLGQFLVVEGPA